MRNAELEKSNIKPVKCGLILIFISGIANIAYLLSIPSDSKNEILLGFSANRLFLLFFLIAGIILALRFLLIISRKASDPFSFLNPLYKSPFIISLLVILLILVSLLSWLAFFSPEYFLGKYYAIFERLRPVLLWLATLLTVVNYWGILINNKFKQSVCLGNLRGLKSFALVAGILFFAFFAIALIYPKLTKDLWFGRYSVPILMTQIVFSWMLVVVIKQIFLASRIPLPTFLEKNFDRIAFLVIWIISVACWFPQPIEFMQDLYFTAIEQHLRPLPPTFEIQPWKDSRTYFFITESVKIGKGIYRSIDKSLFLSIASLINWIADGSYIKMLNYQVFLLAFFPPVVYLIGKELYDRSGGFIAAALAIFQELNGIRIMDEFPVVSSKVLLSEPFMQLWNGLIVLTVILALKKDSHKSPIPILLSGSVLGFSTLFRLNTMIIIPFIILIFTIHFFRKREMIIKSVLIFLFGVLLAFTPWMIHNSIEYDHPFAFMKGKVERVIINTRYSKVSSTPNSDEIGYFINPISDLSNGFINRMEFGVKSPNREYPFNHSNYISGKSLTNRPAEPKMPVNQLLISYLFQPEIILRAFQMDFPKIANIFISITRHFLNNLITSFSILPSSVFPQDLFHGSRTQRFWGSFNADSYTGISFPILLINLLVISLGIFRSFRKKRIPGLIPIAVYLGYHLSNGLALSSGNRYAQPASWMIYFYFAVGLAAVSEFFLRLVNPASEKYINTSNSSGGREKNGNHPKRTWILVTFFVLVIGSSPVLADTLPVSRYPTLEPIQVLQVLYQNPECRNKLILAGYESEEHIIGFLNDKKVTASIGEISGVMRINNEQFKIIFQKSRRVIKTEGSFLTFSLIEEKRGNPPQLYLFNSDTGIDLHNGMDAMMVYTSQNEVIAMGIIDKEAPLTRILADDLEEYPLECVIIPSQ